MKNIKETNKNSILQKAKAFAIEAHESIDQRRKFTNEPYANHCERVVKILQTVISDEAVLAAAWMHDILEDVAPLKPYYSEEKIRQLFGDNICDMVIALTDTPYEFGNRAARKAQDRNRLAAATNEIKTIKLADLIDNFIDIQKHDPNFLIIYAKETALLLPFLSDGNNLLYNQLSTLLKRHQASKKKPVI